jgi:pimeloyl-ACP methyl ester carboxylesterase
MPQNFSERTAKPWTSPVFRYVRQERQGAHVAMLIHGTMDDSRCFEPMARHLSDWTAVSYDRRGWGRSRELGGPDTSLSTHVKDLRAILEGMPAAPIVAGHSYGAVIALSAADRHPELFAGIVAFEPPLRWLPWWPVDDPWEQAVLSASRKGPEEAARSLLTAVVGQSGRMGRGDRPMAGLAADGASLIAEMGDGSLDVPQFEPLTLETPVVVAAGSASLAHHKDVARRLADLLPNSKFIEVEGAKHLAHLSHPKEFASLVRDALELSVRAKGAS